MTPDQPVELSPLLSQEEFMEIDEQWERATWEEKLAWHNTLASRSCGIRQAYAEELLGIANHYASTKRESVSPWQPIETAPKDGTYFLALMQQDFSADDLKGERQGWLHLPRYPFVCSYQHDEDGGFFAEADTCGIHGKDCEPTHWMPLPAPPQPE